VTRHLRSAQSLLLLLLPAIACDNRALPPDSPTASNPSDPAATDPTDRTAGDTGWMAPDVRRALEKLPRAEVAAAGRQGFPAFIRGDLGQVAPGAAGRPLTEADLRPVLDAIAPVFRLEGGDFALVRMRQDDLGSTHAIYRQMAYGMEVQGGDLRIHVTADGKAYAANGTAHGQLELPPPAPSIAIDTATRAALAFAGTNGSFTADPPVLRYVIVNTTGSLHLSWEVAVKGTAANGTPVHDLVQVDALSGEVVGNRALIYAAKFREMYDANYGATAPGQFQFDDSVDSGPWSDSYPIFDNWQLMGQVYDFYYAVFRRDSYDNFGHRLRSSVNYVGTNNGQPNPNNAYWDTFSQQMLFGPGDSASWGNFAVSMDVAAHELTHAVTDAESALWYDTESGALNEAMSDIFASILDDWRKGGFDADTWRLAEDIYTPSNSTDAMRYMDNPTADGYSRDYYPLRLYGTEGCVADVSNDYCGVHGNSGIANLAFYLMVAGGTRHDVAVTGLGMAKARAILYRANTMYLTEESTFAVARAATMQAARDLYDSTTATAIGQAWQAVGVQAAPGNDNFTSAITIPSLPFSQNGDTSYATFETLEPNSPVGTVWYKWVPAASGMVQFQAFGHGDDPQLRMFVGSAVARLAVVEGEPDVTVAGVVAGQTYRVQISQPALFADEFTLSAAYRNDAVVYLSDLAWKSATNASGPVEKDKSNGGSGTGDGKTLTLAGVKYSKGLGVNAASDVRYNLAGAYTRFLAEVGVDDEVGTAGSVVFQVYGDGVKLFDSGKMTGSSSTKSVSVDVTGRSELRLVATDSGDGNTSDHADWADARLANAMVTDMTPPAPPLNARLSFKSDQAVTLEWDLPASDDPDHTEYQVMRGSTHVGTSRYFLDLRDLSPATAYSFTVRALDSAGNLSGPSNTVSVTTDASPAGTGLHARYYVGKQLDVDANDNAKVDRTDGTVNFDWGTGSPATGIPADGFSARWTGEVLPAYSQTYTFYTSTSDGVRLWVDGRLLIDKWVNQGTTEWSKTIALQANRRYEIRMEMYENTGSAAAKLSWSSSSQAKQIIPKSRLYPSF
jgi:Zn-dependent metalloprotease